MTQRSAPTPRWLSRLLRVAMGLMLLTAATPGPDAGTLEDYLRLSGPATSQTFRYGPEPSQVAEFYRPRGDETGIQAVV